MLICNMYTYLSVTHRYQYITQKIMSTLKNGAKRPTGLTPLKYAWCYIYFCLVCKYKYGQSVVSVHVVTRTRTSYWTQAIIDKCVHAKHDQI